MCNCISDRKFYRTFAAVQGRSRNVTEHSCREEAVPVVCGLLRCVLVFILKFPGHFSSYPHIAGAILLALLKDS